MANNLVVPTKNPGELFIPALGKTVQQVELREDDIYDTVQVSGAIAAGTEYEFFRDIQNKNEQHTNIPQSRRIQAGDEVAVFRIGVHPRAALGATQAAIVDIKQVIENGHLDLRFNRRIVTSGPAVKYPSGYGLSGFSDGNAAAPTPGVAAMSVGVPSVAAAPTLFVPQQLKDNDDIICKLRFPGAAWAASYAPPSVSAAPGLAVSVFLRGVIKSPLGK
jgi:hypothetical protein